MESFFFGADLARCRESMLASGLHRVDVSNGLVYLDTPTAVEATVPMHYYDRMAILVFVRSGSVRFVQKDRELSRIEAGQIGLLTSRRQDWEMHWEGMEGFCLFVADFFFKRYLDAEEEGAIDRLYGWMETEGRLHLVGIEPLDALSLYLIDKITGSAEEPMHILRGEHRVVELMLHRLGRLELLPAEQKSETFDLVDQARKILEGEFADPPTIEILAHRCATNASKLKKAFKHTYKTTIYGYIQHLRMEEANILLRQERLSIGEVARRVGYRHQGHFSRLFHAVYGIYPRELK